MFVEPWFKEALLKWNPAVREGLVGKEAFVQDSATFNVVKGYWNKPDQKMPDTAGTG